MKINQLKKNLTSKNLEKELEEGRVQVWARLQAEVLRVKNQDLVFPLMVLKEVKCLYIEDCLNEVSKIHLK